MSSPKKKQQNRREFLTKVGLGSVAAAGLSSCEISDLNFIGKFKSNSPLAESELENFVSMANSNSNIEKTILRMKKNIFSLKKIPVAINDLFSDKNIKNLMTEETEFYKSYYKTNYTASEIRELTKIMNSKVWRKYIQMNNELSLANSGDVSDRPSNKFIAKVNALLSENKKI
jgi:hypothetical protein